MNKKKYTAPKLTPIPKEDLKIEANYILVGSIRIQLHTPNGMLESTIPNPLAKHGQKENK